MSFAILSFSVVVSDLLHEIMRTGIRTGATTAPICFGMSRLFFWKVPAASSMTEIMVSYNYQILFSWSVDFMGIHQLSSIFKSRDSTFSGGCFGKFIFSLSYYPLFNFRPAVPMHLKHSAIGRWNVSIRQPYPASFAVSTLFFYKLKLTVFIVMLSRPRYPEEATQKREGEASGQDV